MSEPDYYLCDANGRFMTICDESRKVIASPYVLSGLTHMYDARTAPDGTSWKNRIVTASSATVKNAAVYTPSKKCFTFDKSLYHGIQCESPTTTDFTFEIVTRVDWVSGSSTNYFGGIAGSAGQVNFNGTCVLQVLGSGTLKIVFKRTDSLWFDFISPFYVDPTKVYTFGVVVRSGGICELYVDGVLVKSETVPAYATPTGAALFIGGSSLLSDGNKTSGDYYALREYSRALTATEMKRNARADKDAYKPIDPHVPGAVLVLEGADAPNGTVWRNRGSDGSVLCNMKRSTSYDAINKCYDIHASSGDYLGIDQTPYDWFKNDWTLEQTISIGSTSGIRYFAALNSTTAGSNVAGCFLVQLSATGALVLGVMYPGTTWTYFTTTKIIPPGVKFHCALVCKKQTSTTAIFTFYVNGEFIMDSPVVNYAAATANAVLMLGRGNVGATVSFGSDVKTYSTRIHMSGLSAADVLTDATVEKTIYGI